MRFFRDRRRPKRTKADWNATLRCIFSDAEQTIPVKLFDVSLRGARLALERLQVGPHHVMINDQPINYELSIILPEDSINIPMEICWCNRDAKQHFFFWGVEFPDISAESKTALKRALENI
ncbi:MAG: PilZ domain-containing protein [Syntrophobacteraceae bacterium]